MLALTTFFTATLLTTVPSGSDTAGYADVNGTRLYYETRGQGDPVVLVHGGFMDSRMWDSTFRRLSRDFLVIRYDLRGAGRSQRNHKQPYSPAEDLSALLRFLGKQRTHVVGLSRGGAIALDFSLRFPDLTATLTVAEPALPGMRFTPPSTVDQNPGPPSMAEIARVATQDRQKAVDLMLLHPPFERLRQMPTELRTMRGLMLDNAHLLEGGDGERFVVNPSIADRLGTIRVPVLAIVGEEKPESYPGQVHTTLLRGLRGIEAATITGAGHFSNIEKPEEFARTVRSFLLRHKTR